MPGSRYTGHRLIPPPDGLGTSWRSVLTHTHMLHGELRPPRNYGNLVEWAAKTRIAAVGVGSPFTPKTARAYGRFEDRARDIYYSEDFDVQSVKYPEEAQRVIKRLNELSKGRTLFYLDNETPKARYGHMWWIGWHHDYPEWHDYDQPFDRWMVRAQKKGYTGPEPMPYERRPYMEIVATQRAKGALGIWAHPTSWWYTDKKAFVTNIASEMPAHLVADGFIDGLVIMGYDAYRPGYLSLWFHLLDLGYCVTGLAESDVGLSSERLWDTREYLTYVYAPRGLKSARSLVHRVKSGCLFSSSGPHVELKVDGKRMGSVAETSGMHLHDVRIKAWPRAGHETLGLIELIGKGGKVIWSEQNTPGGEFRIQVPGRKTAGYLVVRVFGAGEGPGMAPRDVEQFAVTNPVYLHPKGHHFPAPLISEVSIRFKTGNPFVGGKLRIESAFGDIIEEHRIRQGNLKCRIPASGRVTLNVDGQRPATHYLINANPEVTRLQQYLYRGQFLRDWPGFQPGDVPPEAFAIRRFARAMKKWTWNP